MICGIDVGLKGAIALLYPSGPSYIYDMPALQKEINGAVLSGIFTDYSQSYRQNLRERKMMAAQKPY